MMKALIRIVALLACAGYTSAAVAEAVTYTYDAKGRLVRIVKINGVYSQVDSTITYDKADNRTRVNTTATPHP